MEAIWQDVRHSIFMLLTYNAGITCGSRGDNVVLWFHWQIVRCVYLSVTALVVNARHRTRKGQTVLKCYSSLHGTNIYLMIAPFMMKHDMENWSMSTNPLNRDIP